MKSIDQLLLLLTLITISLCSCTTEPSYIPPEPSFNFAYSYFPSEDGYQWQYIKTTTDGTDSVLERSSLTGIYDKNQKSILYSKNGSYSNWYNYGSNLKCCNDMTLLDYNKLDCSEDSTLINEDKFKSNGYNTYVKIYQHCDTKNILVEGYEGTDCIKTHQINTVDDGTKLIIDRYFGFGVGLIYERQISYDVNQRISTIETKELVSHAF